MKKFLVNTVVAAMCSTFASAAFALPDSPFYVGALVGDATLAIQSRTHVENNPIAPKITDRKVGDSKQFSLMTMAGFRFTDVVGMELQYLSSLQDDRIYGMVRVNDPSVATNTSEMFASLSAAGLFAVFQGGEDAYVKARIGIAQSEASFETDFASATFSTADFALGLSVGQKLGNLGSVELIYMRYPDVIIGRGEFAESFGSTAPFNSYTTVRRDTGLEVMTFGYVFQF